MASDIQNDSTMQMACGEREDFADLLAGLSPDQWEQASLCERWRVRDVVAHVLSYDELGRWGLVRRFAKAGSCPTASTPSASRSTPAAHPSNSPSWRVRVSTRAASRRVSAA
jgi:uncharacterized protein (TIGR03083 family)